jgi:phosphatidylinositol 3-kinase
MMQMVQNPMGLERRENLKRQGHLVEKLTSICADLRSSKDSRPKKIEWLQSYIADPRNGICSFPPLTLPLDPAITVNGIIAEDSSIFKSQLLPLRITFHCVDNSKYKVIFKCGDDLRQDQLVVQVFSLMDGLLRKENLDLKLTTYKVLATGVDHGLIQFIDALPLASILSSYQNNLQLYLKRGNKEQKEDNDCFGVDASVMDTYIKSCAGYCVLTYILGIGDRHLDNLLLTVDGKLFHVDFGFILGNDPKPFPPPMKLCKEMVDAMGGASSSHYNKFKTLCCTAFIILRKSSNLILNLFTLMADSNISNIKLDPEKAVFKVQEKFRLDLTDEEAIQYFQSLISESTSALFPQFVETVHRWAQYWRK